MSKDRMQEAVRLAVLLTRYGKPGLAVEAVYDDVRRLTQAARTLATLNEWECNINPTDDTRKRWDRRRDLAQQTIGAILREHYPQIHSVHFDGDQRGFPVKLEMPGGEYNTFGGRETGWGIGTL